MGKKIKIKQSDLFIFCFLCLITIVSLYPLLQYGMVFRPGMDLPYHLLRIEGLKQCLLEGDFLGNIHSLVFDGYGYANGLFYPQLLLYFPAVLRILGLSLGIAYKLFIVVASTSTCISMYFSSKYITRSRYASLISTTILLLSQYRIGNVFIRAALGEYCAYIFIPIVFAGMINLVYYKFDKPFLLVIGFLGLMFTHTISLMIIGIVFLIFMLINFKSILDLKIIGKLALAGIVVVLLSCAFWMPVIEQFLSQSFQISKMTDRVGENAIMPLKLIDTEYYKSLGLPIALLLIVRIFIRYNHKISLKILDVFLVLGILLSILSTKIVPWKYFENTFLNSIQFPWRMLASATILLSISIGGYLNMINKNKRLRTIVLAFIFIFSSSCFISFYNPYIDQKINISDRFSLKENKFTVGAGEWLPLDTDVSSLKTPYYLILEDDSKVKFDYKKGTTISFQTNNNSTYYDVPLLYYKGYTSEISLENGTINSLALSKSPNNNLVRVANPKNLYGKITVHYKATIIQKISYLITLLTIMFILGFVLFKKFSHKDLHWSNRSEIVSNQS